MKATLQRTPDRRSGRRSTSEPKQSSGARAADLARNQPRVAAQRELAEAVRDSPYVAAQRRQLRAMFGEAAQFKADRGERASFQEDASSQQPGVAGRGLPPGAFGTTQLQREPAQNGSKTGLPEGLKVGIEAVSGMSMDGVQVHYNSDRPEQLNALAYAQGSEIHVGPGQERHLPHEAWHVVQQAEGRVRPTMQMTGGTAVNDDAGLEHEADRMGAAALRTPGPRTTKGERARALQGMEGSLGQVSGRPAKSGRAVAQRTIHQYDKKKGWEVAEIGTKGRFGLPADDKDGKFFNDLTDKSGTKIDEVRAGLVDAMMITGSLDSLKNDKLPLAWGELAKTLSAAAVEAQKAGVVVSPLMLGELFMSWDEGKEENKYGYTVDSKLKGIKDFKREIVEEAAAFVIRFMEANEQIPYILRQSWYTSGEYEIHVDINFYHDRPMGKDGLGMHKDTGGDNLFVNLIFANTEETPATEWTQDREPAKGQKADLMASLVPKGMIGAIDEAKGKLGKTALASGEKTIQGGTMPPMAFVSWVDELIWHSTPSLSNRLVYDSKSMSKYLKKHWKTDEHDRKEAIFAMLEDDNTLVAEKAKAVKAKGRSFDMAAWDKIERNLGYLEKRRLKKEIRKFDWGSVKWSGRSGNELDVDPRTNSVASHIPTGVTGRTRANSDAATLKKVKEAAEKQKLRSFIRTWVRVVKKGSK